MTGTEAPNIFPFLRYAQAPAAIEWLERAFGFRRGLVVPNPDGTIAHAEIHLGPGVVMLGSAREDDLNMRVPADLGAVNQGIYAFVPDVDAHCARALAAGAQILRPPADTSYGSREYVARDPEGNLWSFGTYRPEPA